MIDASDLEMLPDNMSFNDDFVSYTVKGDGSDSIIRIVKKLESNAQTQTEKPKLKIREFKQSLAKMTFPKWKRNLRNFRKNLIS